MHCLQFAAFLFTTCVLHAASERKLNRGGGAGKEDAQRMAVQFLNTRVSYLQRALDLLYNGFGVGGCGDAHARSVPSFCVHSQRWQAVVKDT